VSEEDSASPFASRDFVLWWAGLFISMMGTQMTWVAVPYQLYLLSGKNPMVMGGVGVARALPIIGMGLLGGAIADSVDRRRLLAVTQTGLMVISGVLAWAAWTGASTVALLYALVVLGGLLVAVDLPARQAMLPNLVSRRAFPRAVSLNTWTMQMASLLGPMAAGVLLAWTGPAILYLIDAVSFGAILVALAVMRPLPARPGKPVVAGLSSIVEGVRFVRSQPVMWVTMTLDFVATFFADAKYLMPIFAKDILHGDERTLGLLLAAPPAGAALTAFALSFLQPLQKQGLLVLAGIAVYGFATVGFGCSTSIALALVMLALTGAADTVSMVVRNTLRQELTPDHLRARMASVNMVFFMGGPLLGEFEAGVVARLVSPRVAVVSGGVACVLAVVACSLLTPWLWAYERVEPPAIGG